MPDNYQAIAYSMVGANVFGPSGVDRGIAHPQAKQGYAKFTAGTIEDLRHEAKIMGFTMIVLDNGDDEEFGAPLYCIGASGAVYRLQMTSRPYPPLPLDQKEPEGTP